MVDVKTFTAALNYELVLRKGEGTAKEYKGKKEILFHVDNVFTGFLNCSRVSFTNMLIIFQKQNHSAVLKCVVP